jgi:hypothetical protein
LNFKNKNIGSYRLSIAEYRTVSLQFPVISMPPKSSNPLRALYSGVGLRTFSRRHDELCRQSKISRPIPAGARSQLPLTLYLPLPDLFIPD